ncbi:hypothetical protein T11_11997 [Trichinella zimbabwensis]|uniref:Uncharacterized protein n=1 Tax=Trichinella zimbabwensis TaxID=268475 RepID=A0A0V1G8Y0_9BILA|nr:hypothetical protein T11_11997 [Trichinella zimbabwensis]
MLQDYHYYSVHYFADIHRESICLANACDLAKKLNLAATGKPTTTRKHV